MKLRARVEALLPEGVELVSHHCDRGRSVRWIGQAQRDSEHHTYDLPDGYPVFRAWKTLREAEEELKLLQDATDKRTIMATNFSDTVNGTVVATVWSRPVPTGGLCLELTPQACFVEMDTPLAGDDGSTTTLRKLCCDKAQLGAQPVPGFKLDRPEAPLPREVTHGFEEKLGVLTLRASALLLAVETSDWSEAPAGPGAKAARQSLQRDLSELLHELDES